MNDLLANSLLDTFSFNELKLICPTQLNGFRYC